MCLSEPSLYTAKRVPLTELFRTFLFFGMIGFGGPAAHIALMERELVARRAWLSRQHFLSLLAAINLVPGPNSTEMAFHIGLVTGGFWGCVLSGVAFIVPAVLLSLGLGIVYVAAGALPAVQGILLGVQPIVLVLILSAAYNLALKALDSAAMRILGALAMAVAALTVVPFMQLFSAAPIYFPELLMLLGTGTLYMSWRSRLRAAALLFVSPLFSIASQLVEALKPSLADLFLRFLIIGGTLFGSGYVLIAYMERAFVTETNWLTPRQLVDAFSIGQATPGPVLSTAAAAGYIMHADPNNLWAGVPSGIVSAVAVFLPAFLIVLALGKFMPLLERYTFISDFLKGVNAGVIALLAATFLNLAWSTFVRVERSVDWLSVGMAIAAFFALERLKWSPLLLVTLGIGIGITRTLFNWL
ncbi:MAG: chromate efflux transporter [Anaerolineae bacterium]|nr:chromate efflux transporter [Anaerolineae bacterium]MDW8300569.1 chromate efflux transporter [Anaerolineae bacterium]